MGNSDCFLRGSQLWHSRPTQSTVHAECCKVSIIHRILTWTIRSLTCKQMLMHATAHGGVQTHLTESALKVDPGKTIPYRAKESNLRQRRAGLTLYLLSYTPILTPTWTLGSDSEFRFSPQSAQCNMVVESKACSVVTVGGGSKSSARSTLLMMAFSSPATTMGDGSTIHSSPVLFSFFFFFFFFEVKISSRTAISL